MSRGSEDAAQESLQPAAEPQAPRRSVVPHLSLFDDRLIKLFRIRLNRWYGLHARALPWRGIRDPYATWLSEIMLQQTRVATVIERYSEFLHRFPTVEALAGAEEADVLAFWSGLGYYRRARMLHRGAQFVLRELGGKLPRTVLELRTLPGVGEYTAAAVASIAFGEAAAVLDGNVERVLLRLLGRPEDRTGRARAGLNEVAQSLIPLPAKRRDRGNPPGDHNQAMMELGATLCLPRAPLCLHCPVYDFCRTRGEHPTLGREKQTSRTVAYLLSLRKRGTATEVLLERRDSQASLMPGMLELPPLPLTAVEGREPVLRVRHSITNTNYYVQVFAQAAAGPAPAPAGPFPAEDHEEASPADVEDFRRFRSRLEDHVFVSEPEEHDASEGTLLDEVPAAERDLIWTAVSTLASLPLTGLARKVLQRLRVMAVPLVARD